MSKIFINFRRDQTSVEAQQLANQLRNKFGKKRSIITDGFSDWIKHLRTKPNNCHVLISVIGPKWLESFNKNKDLSGERTRDSVRDEIMAALQHNIPILPVILNHTRVPEDNELPLEIRGMFRLREKRLHCTNFEADASEIAAELEKIICDRVSLSRSKADIPRPYSIAPGTDAPQTDLPTLETATFQPRLLGPKVVMLLVIALLFGVLTGPTILSLLGSQNLLSPLRRSAEPLEQEHMRTKQHPAKQNKTLAELNKFIRKLEAVEHIALDNRTSISKLSEKFQLKDGHIKIKDHDIISPRYTSSVVLSIPTQQILNEHSGWVYAASFSPDNRYLVSGSWDTTLKVWDWKRGDEAFTLGRHGDRVEDVVFSPDGKTILSASSDKTLKLWNRKTGREIKTLDLYYGILAAAFSPDGRYIVAGGKYTTLTIWDTQNDYTPHKLRRAHSGNIADVAFSPDGHLILSASKDKTIKLWNFEFGNTHLRNTLTEHTGAVNTVSFSPDGHYIVSGSNDKLLKIWDTGNDKSKITLSGHKAAIQSAAFSPDGYYIVSGSDDGMLLLWDWRMKRLIATLEGYGAPIHTVAFSPDGRFVVAGGNDNALKLWDVSNWTLTELSQQINHL